MPGRSLPGHLAAALATIAALAMLTGCATNAADRPAPSSSSSASASLSASTSPSASSAPSASASPSPTPAGIDPDFVPALASIQMVEPHVGWAVGSYAIFATADGTHWSKQLASTEQFVGVDFISASTGWAVGARTLLGTSDGGRTWQALGEAPKPIRSVHFISASEGWGVAGGGSPQMNHGWLMPGFGGTLVKSDDGGRNWANLDSPVDPQSVCFSNATHGWLATSEGLVFFSGDGGHSWTEVLETLQSGANAGQQIVLECSAPSALWVETTIPNGAGGHLPYVVYATQDGHSWKTVMSESGTTSNLLPGVPAGPDSHPGSFSVVDPTDAAFVGDGPATAVSQCVIASNGGSTLRRTGSIANSSETFGAAFVSVTTGWVLTRIIDGDYVIEATSDGGYHWTQQLAITPSSAG
jgi:photosystem II stability/assembly factor-like uncharacterized protein